MEPQGTGAVPHENKGKRRTRSAEEIVSRYQMRIVKAQNAGKLSRVKHLQGMLAHCRSAQKVAVERVLSNKGSKTPGVDKDT